MAAEYADVFAVDALRERVAGLLHDEVWVRRYWAWPSVGEALTDAWDAFSHQLKYVNRFVVWRLPADADHRAGGEIAPAEVLDAVGGFVDLYPESLTCELAPDTPVWRARPHDLPFAPDAGGAWHDAGAPVQVQQDEPGRHPPLLRRGRPVPDRQQHELPVVGVTSPLPQLYSPHGRIRSFAMSRT